MRDRPAHQGAGEDEELHARQARRRADGSGERLFSHERNRIDGDAFAADIVTIRLGDRAERHLPDLRAAAHDDDALAVDLGERGNLLDGVHAIEALQIGEQGVRRRIERELEVDVRAVAGRMQVDVADIRLVIGEDLGHGRHHAGAIGRGHHDCVQRAHRVGTDVISGALPSATSDLRMTDSGTYRIT